jgi:hypothetical protein
MQKFLLAVTCALSVVPAFAAEVRTYDAVRTMQPPVADGIVSPGEWDSAAPAQGNWGELLQLSPPDFDTANNRFRMLWDESALYILYQTSQTQWVAPPTEPNPQFDLVNEQLYLYFDPNLDGEVNFAGNPDEQVDGYELGFNQVSGHRVSTNANRNGVGFVTEARIDNIFGDQGFWNRGGDPLAGAALQSIVVAQNNSTTGGLAEISIPWSAFNSTGDTTTVSADFNLDGRVDAADYTVWRDSLGAPSASLSGDANGDGAVDTADYLVWRSQYGTRPIVADGLFHPFAPAVGDSWYFNMGQISNADSGNFMPVYNWTESFFFAARPHAELRFVAANSALAIVSTVPEPASYVPLVATCCAVGWLCVMRRGRPQIAEQHKSLCANGYRCLSADTQSTTVPRRCKGW